MMRTSFRLLAVLGATLLPTLPVPGGNLVVDGSLVSLLATGTAPLEVSSTTRVENLNADLLDGLEGSAYARSLGNVVRVATSGGDFTSIQAALDSITGASAANPFLVVVGPGVYAERVVMKPYVDIQGSGEGVTTITQSGSTDPDFGTVAGADDAELRFLTVVNTGGAEGAVGIDNPDASPRLFHVTVEVDSTLATVIGIRNGGTTPSSPELSDVTVMVFGSGSVIGIWNPGGADTRMTRVRVRATGLSSGTTYGIFSFNSAPTLDDVVVEVTNLGTSALVGGVLNDSVEGALFRSIRIEATGGGNRYGMSNANTDLTIRDLEVHVSGDGTTSFGVSNQDGTVVLESCSIDAQGGTTTYGVQHVDSSGELRDCTVKASGAGFTFALEGSGATDPRTFDAQHSRLEGAISFSPDYTARFGASQLDGSVTGTTTCAASYDGSFTELDSGCAVPP